MSDTDSTTTENSAIDRDFSEAERDYEDQVAEALRGIVTEPTGGTFAIDLVTHQLLYVHEKVADTLGEYYEDENFSLATYKQHPFLPVRTDDAVFECYYINDLSIQNLHAVGESKDYAFPRGRLARVPMELAWLDEEVGSL